jgi:hypothetical protein
MSAGRAATSPLERVVEPPVEVEGTALMRGADGSTYWFQK